LTAIGIVTARSVPINTNRGKYKDPRVLQLIDKITLHIDTEMDKKPRSGYVGKS